MHPGGMRSAMDLCDFEKSANLKHPNVYAVIFISYWLPQQELLTQHFDSNNYKYIEYIMISGLSCI